ncbi:Gfo/Idh/MocA family protein [Acuticoccus kandeliae]|uniref:Gfo/Idh/MocA family protein n=1 Tax=Acuticoccus kandeliae TaxID=2073160 RepID=UPI00196B5298|nr:Gfo/Idh/MocA family oxidoreductase [Acuticoccus kandeliae]
MGKIAIVGAGYVADSYMRSTGLFPDHRFVGAWDENPERLARFCAHWRVPAARGLDDLFAGAKRPDLLLNLTPPSVHAAINRAALEAGVPVYCEKPLATTLADARDLMDLSAARGVPIASAPSTILGEAAQTMWSALRRRMIGRPQLIYADLDDGYLAQAPHEGWVSESGARWNAAGAFATGAVLDYAGYHLTWLMAMFGPVRTLTGSTATIGGGAEDGPNFASAVLTFDHGVVARLTCSTLGRRDHRLRIIGERGTLVVDDVWDDGASVRIERRRTVRGRLVEGLVREPVRIARPPYARPFARRRLPLNRMLGPDEMLAAIAAGRAPRLAGDFALHLTEVMLAMHNARSEAAVAIQSTFEPMAPMAWAKPSRRESTVEPIKLGILGTGPSAIALADAVRHERRLAIVAVGAAEKDAADAFAGELGVEHAFGGVDALVAGEVDAVYIALPLAERAAAAIAALKAGKPVLCEAPLGASPAEVEAVIAAAQAARVLLVEALPVKLLPAIGRALDLANSGTLGTPTQLSLEVGEPLPREARPDLFAAPGIVATLSDPLALALALFGEVAEIDAVATRQDGVPVHASLILRHSRGGISQIAASLVGMMSNAARIACTEGAVRIEEPIGAAETLGVRRLASPPPAADAESHAAPVPGAATRAQIAARLKRSGVARRVGRAVTPPRMETVSYGASAFSPLLEHFARLVAERATESPIAPLALSAGLAGLRARIATALAADAETADSADLAG